MRAKIILIITVVMLLIAPTVAAATVYSSAYRQQVLGYIGQELVPSVNLDTTVLPFDIESSTVELNPSPSIVKGLRIGSYAIRANSNFQLTITHTKLTCMNPSNGTNLPTEVDYRLDVFCVDNSNPSSPKNTFKSCTASGSDPVPVIHLGEKELGRQGAREEHRSDEQSLKEPVSETGHDCRHQKGGDYPI